MKLIFYRFEKYNNSECVRKLPHNGKSWWVIEECYEELLVEFFSHLYKHGVNPKDITVVREENMVYNNMHVLDFRIANKYVLGESDVIPELVEFDETKHPQRWVWTESVVKGLSLTEIENLHSSGIEMTGGVTLIPAQDFQILTT